MWPLFLILACSSEPSQPSTPAPREPEAGAANSLPVAAFAQPIRAGVTLPVVPGQPPSLPSEPGAVLLEASPELAWIELTPTLKACHEARVEPWLQVQTPAGEAGYLVPLRPALKLGPAVAGFEWTLALNASDFTAEGQGLGTRSLGDLEAVGALALELKAQHPEATRVTVIPATSSSVQDVLAVLDALAGPEGELFSEPGLQTAW